MPTLDAVPCLQGQRILVVEDDFFQARDMEEELKAAGATVVGPVPSIKDAAFLLAITDKLDVAMLDINLGGQLVYPLADQLVAQGTPIIFATGYSQHDIPARFRAVPCCEKPVVMSHVVLALGAAIAAPPKFIGIEGSPALNLHATDDGVVGWEAFATYMDRSGRS